MANIFGIDVAGIVYSAVQGQLFVGTLTRTVNKQMQNFAFEGVPGGDEESINSQSLASSGRNEIIIIAKSITPSTVPAIQDIIRLLDKSYIIVSVETDPAEAAYTCLVQPR